MLTHHQALAIEDALLELRLRHPWHPWYPAAGTMIAVFDCVCSRCHRLDILRKAVHACGEAQRCSHPSRERNAVLTHAQVLELQCALIKIRMQHPWHYDDDGVRPILDCTCNSCQWIDKQVVAVLAFTGD